jgi:N-acetylneuraminic acid mutarotase
MGMEQSTLLAGPMEALGVNLRVLAGAVVLAAVMATGAARATDGWQSKQTLPLPRSEVASAVLRGKIVVVGGFLADGASSARVDVYDPATDRWSRLPDLPVAVNHAMAAADGRRVYVAGGYADGTARRDLFVLENGRWRRLPSMPAARAAAGAAVVAGKLYVVGGVVSQGRLAREAFVYEPGRRRWSAVAGPTPREHLGVAALGGTIYAVGGRSAGFDTNFDLVEELRPATGRWRELATLPDRRGGTALGAGSGLLVSIGGEEQAGTIEEVYAYDPTDRRWSRLADLPTPRHGLAVEVVSGAVYAIAGGPEPGLAVSGANEALPLPSDVP